MSTIEVTVQQPANSEPEFEASVKSLQDEHGLLLEALQIEKTHTAELIRSFKSIIEPLCVSYDVKDAWNAERTDIQRAVLTAKGFVCVTYVNGTVQSKSLDSMSSEGIIKIVTLAIPAVKQRLADLRQITTLRAGIIERMARELGKLQTEPDVSAGPLGN